MNSRVVKGLFAALFVLNGYVSAESIPEYVKGKDLKEELSDAGWQKIADVYTKLTPNDLTTDGLMSHGYFFMNSKDMYDIEGFTNYAKAKEYFEAIQARLGRGDDQNLNNINSAYWLGIMYLNGKPGVDKNPVAAFNYLKQVADAERAWPYLQQDALKKVAEMYRTGNGIEANEKRAEEYARRAEEYFEPKAQEAPALVK